MSEFSILLVEDNADDIFLTTRMLRKLPFGVEIEIAKSGDEALKRILAADVGRDELPSLILLDLQLPKIDGIKCLTGIRQRYNENELPVIILSSSDNNGDIDLCRELGINSYLNKPLEANHLQLLLENLQHQAARSSLPLRGTAAQQREE